MTGRALQLVTVDTDLCTWCLGKRGEHDPKCYVAEYLRKVALAKAIKQREDDNAKTGL